MSGAAIAVASMTAAAAAAPKVIAITIGITGYPDSTLTPAAPNAERVAQQIRMVFPTAQIDRIVNDAANLVSVRTEIDLSHIPEQSLVIIYFSGHGERAADAEGTTYLRLAGTSHDEYVASSIALDDVVRAIGQAPKGVRIMIFIDACFAGVDAQGRNGGLHSILPELWDRLEKRAFMMVSSAGTEPSLRGYFTDALLDAWAHPRQACEPPYEFWKDVTARVRAKAKEMSPELLFGEKLQMCVSDLGIPSSLVSFRFNRPVSTACDFTVGGITQIKKPSEPTYDRILPKRDVAYAIACAGRPVASGTLSGFDRDIIEVPIAVSDEALWAARTVSTSYEADVAIDVARAVAAFGDNASHYYYQAAVAAARAKRDPQPFLDQVSQDGSLEGRVARLALSQSRRRQAALWRMAGDPALENVAKELGDLSLHDSSSVAYEVLSEMAEDTKQKQYFQFRGLVESTLQSNDKRTSLFAQKLKESPLTSFQAEIVDDTVKSRVPDVDITSAPAWNAAVSPRALEAFYERAENRKIDAL